MSDHTDVSNDASKARMETGEGGACAGFDCKHLKSASGNVHLSIGNTTVREERASHG